jgi:hypothetical protein
MGNKAAGLYAGRFYGIEKSLGSVNEMLTRQNVHSFRPFLSLAPR